MEVNNDIFDYVSAQKNMSTWMKRFMSNMTGDVSYLLFWHDKLKHSPGFFYIQTDPNYVSMPLMVLTSE